MKKLSIVFIVFMVATVLSTGAYATQFSLLNCKGEMERKLGKKITKHTYEVNIVTGAPLTGGLAELLQSSPAARYAPVGHYVRTKKEGPPGGSAYTVYESSDGFKISIPEVQLADIAAGTYRGTMALPHEKTPVSVLCEDK